MTDDQGQDNRSSRNAIVGFAVVLILGAGLMAVMTQSSQLIEAGLPAPDFELEGLDGTTTSLVSLRGKVVLLDFWSTTCPPCVRQMAELEAIHERYHRDVAVLGINTEGAPPSLLRSFIEDRGPVRYRVLCNGAALSEQYRVNALPTLYVLDREGRIHWSRVGYSPASTIEGVLQDLL